MQIVCLTALTQTEQIVGSLSEATSGSTRYLEATLYITGWQTLAGVAKVRTNTCRGGKRKRAPLPPLRPLNNALWFLAL